MDSQIGQSDLEVPSLLVQGHDDLEYETVRRRHVTGEGHNGDALTSTIGAALTGKYHACQ